MHGNPGLYRRPSGIYAVRIAVPLRLRQAVGKSEIHVSTSLWDLNAAKLAALRILIGWREHFMTRAAKNLAAIVRSWSPLNAEVSRSLRVVVIDNGHLAV